MLMDLLAYCINKQPSSDGKIDAFKQKSGHYEKACQVIPKLLEQFN